MNYVFDDIEVDLDRFEIRRSGEPVPVEPQVLDVIRVLLERHGDLVTKEEVLDLVWGTRFVSESSLTSRIKAARRALGDDGRAQRVIATVHGRGYRFVAPVELAGRRSTIRSIRAQQSTLLERERALDVLDDAVRGAAAGSGQVVLVAGEAGIGKTALIRAFSAGLGSEVRQFHGACDDLITPRALGPFDDMASELPALGESLLDPSVAAVQRVLMAELTSGDDPALVVIEDAHWADEATIDVLTHLVRRVDRTPVALVLTFRDAEVVDGHPLLRVLGRIPAASARHLDLQPLSITAVAALVGDDRAAEVTEVTGGIPFFVTEVASLDPADRATLPASVAHAVLARVGTLPEATRAVLEQISVEPSRTSTAVLDHLDATWHDAVAPSERVGITMSSGEWVSYRHELSRRAVLAAMPGARRRALHQAIAHALVATGGDPERIVHHAHEAGNLSLLVDHTMPAAERSRAASAHRQAWSHLRRVLPLIDRFPPADVPRLLETASLAAYQVDELDEARALAIRALSAAERTGDAAAAGRLHRWLSRVLWYQGRTVEAHEEAGRSIDVLEALPPSEELAWAYSTMSQLAMLSWDEATTRRYGDRALETAAALGAEEVRAHALINLAVGGDATIDRELMRRAIDVAERTGQHHEVVRGLTCVAYDAVDTDRLDVADEFGTRAHRHAVDHEIETLRVYAEATLARVAFLRGQWDVAESGLVALQDGMGTAVNRMAVLRTRTQLAVRRGDDGAAARIAEQRALVDDSAELQRVVPAAEIEAEHAWLRGELDSMVPILRAALDGAMRKPPYAGRLVRWLHEAGALGPVPDGIPEPYRSELLGRWDEAAIGWRDRGMPYEEAMARARAGADGLRTALDIATRLGADPLLEWIERHRSA